MSIRDEMEKHRVAIKECVRNMQGVNPNTSTYKKWSDKMTEHNTALAKLGAQRLSKV